MKKQEEYIPLIPFLIQCIKKERTFKLISFSLVFLIGLLILLLYRQHRELVIISIMLLLTSIKFLNDTLNSSPASYDKIIQALSFQKKQVAWFYIIKIDNMPFGIQLFSRGRLILKLLDGHELSLSIPNKEIPTTINSLQNLLPHATSGYSDKNQQFYLIDPYLLLKTED